MSLKRFLDRVDIVRRMGDEAGYRAWPGENAVLDDWVGITMFLGDWNGREERLLRTAYAEAFRDGGARRLGEVQRMKTDLTRQEAS